MEGKSMTPRLGTAFLFHSSQQLPCLRTLEEFFELTKTLPCTVGKADMSPQDNVKNNLKQQTLIVR